MKNLKNLIEETKPQISFKFCLSVEISNGKTPPATRLLRHYLKSAVHIQSQDKGFLLTAACSNSSAGHWNGTGYFYSERLFSLGKNPRPSHGNSIVEWIADLTV